MMRKGIWPWAVRKMLDQDELSGLQGSGPGLFPRPVEYESRSGEGPLPPQWA